jgi:hypothetical protein
MRFSGLRRHGSPTTGPTADPEDSKFLWLLHTGRRLETSDPRDKVFALLGLGEYMLGRRVMDANYEKSCEEVHLDMAHTCLRMLGDLRMLDMVAHDEASLGPEATLPSWVPRWNDYAPQSLLDVPVRSRREASGGSIIFEYHRFQADGRRLRVHGFVIGSVRQVGLPVLRGMESDQTSRAVIELWSETMAARSGFSRESNQSVTDLILKWAMAWRVGTDNDATNILVNDRDMQLVARVCADFLSYVDHSLSPDDCPLVSPSAVASHLSMADGSWFRYDRSFSRNSFGRRIVWLAESHSHLGIDYGLGPSCAQVGDVLTVLCGASVPYILRPNGEGWLLVGSCYTWGLMRGELFERNPDGRMPVADLEQCEFVLR